MKILLNLQETIPCETCLPSRNRYKTVNARTTEIGLLREHVLKARRTAQQTVTCKNDGAVVDLDSALGMSKLWLTFKAPNKNCSRCHLVFFLLLSL